MISPKELDVVRLRDGRKGTVVEVFDNPLAYLVETEEDMSLWPEVGPEEIVEITYVAK